MPHVFDQNLGSTVANPLSSTSTQALTTSATAAAGTLIVVTAEAFGAGAFTPSVSGGGLTWTVDHSASNGSMRSFVASAYAAAGLASGTVITATYGSNMTDRFVGAKSATGSQVSDTGRRDTQNSSTTGSGDTWVSGALNTGNADDWIVGVGMGDGTNTTTTPNSGWTEVHDANDGQGDTFEDVYQIVSSTGAYTAGGDFAVNGTGSVGVAVAYKAAAGGGAVLVLSPLLLPRHPALRFRPWALAARPVQAELPALVVPAPAATVYPIHPSPLFRPWAHKPFVPVFVAGGTAWFQSLADTITLSDAVVKSMGLAKADTITLSDAIAKTTGLSKADTITLSDALAKAVGKVLADSLSLSDAAVKAIGLVKADTITLSDAAVKAIGLRKADTITLSDAISKAVGKVVADVITLSEGFTPTLGATHWTLSLADTITLADSFHRYLTDEGIPSSTARRARTIFLSRFGLY